MKNLATIITRDSVETAIHNVIKKNIKLIPATKFHLIYNNRSFPPKEIVRLAAKQLGITDSEIRKNYRLNGGNPTNIPLKQLGFTIEQFQGWNISENLKSPPSINKISKICWNTNGWTKPSGRLGKSIHPSHELKWGYSHEEWLLDFSKQISGFHYGFLEPINKAKSRDKYLNNQYNILLYTVCSITKEKFWIGEIKNV